VVETGPMAGAVEQGRDAFARSAWAEAYVELSAADAAEPLATEDLERLALAAALAGRTDESADGWARAYRRWERSGEPARAVRAAFWLAFELLNNGRKTLGGGWIDKAQRLLDDAALDDAALDGVEQGLLRYLTGLHSTLTGDAKAGAAAFTEATEIGERFGDVELTTLARIGLGRCLIYLGEVGRGLALLDEAMLAVTGGELSPIAVGDAYCTVIDGCQEVFEFNRSQAWTAELARWCAGQPSMVPYRGLCLIHRAEILQLRGAWTDAMAEAQRACEWLAEPRIQRAIGSAYYQKAELHRLRGEFEPAELAYREASRLGREPQPGLAQLRLAQGRTDDAVAAVGRMMHEHQDPMSRSRFLPAYVEIMLAAGDTAAAYGACRELAQIATMFRSDLLNAVVSAAQGAVELADEDARAALVPLRNAARKWQELDAPFELARVRVLLGLACQALGDQETADLDLAAAEEVFARLGAAPDLARVRALSRRAPSGSTHGLTPRELQVLRLLSTGGTNKVIAAQLVLSERTVDRHVSSILTKLGVPSRAAATAYAYQHQLV
jgi:DNA-binding CsgD family transcriptional regulator